MIKITNQMQGRAVSNGSTVATSQQTSSKGAVSGQDRPQVSAALSSAIKHMVEQGMPVDLDRVMSVRNAIADGQYPVDPSKIAQKILQFDRPVTPSS